jgi:putative peptidoglycan lipid II flippase
MIIPVILATGAGSLGLVVDRMLASGLPEGSIAALNFGFLLSQFPLGIFAVAVTTVIYPTFAEYAAKKDLTGLRHALVAGVRVTLFIVLPMSVAFVVLRQPMVRVLFQRGAFNPRATGLTATALLFFSLGLAPMALQNLISRVYFSLQDTLTPMLLGIGAVAVNIVLNLLLIRPLAHGGLALSTSLAALFSMVLLFMVLRRRMGELADLRGQWGDGPGSSNRLGAVGALLPGEGLHLECGQPGSGDPAWSCGLRDCLIAVETAGAGILHRFRAAHCQASVGGLRQLR